MLEWKSKKFDDEKHKLEEHMKRLGGLMEQSNKVTSSKLRQTTASNNVQQAKLKKKVSLCLIKL